MKHVHDLKKIELHPYQIIKKIKDYQKPTGNLMIELAISK